MSEVRATLLHNRGVRSAAQVGPFLDLDPKVMRDPLRISGMARAAEMLRGACRGGRTVAVYGDFDVDGLTGTAILCRVVEDLGGNALPYIPNRITEGHGLNESAVRRLAADGAALIVTVDCGTTDAAEVHLAASLGMDAIVTDHHTASASMPGEVPVVNPTIDDGYPFDGLTGAGVALKLAQAAYGRSLLALPAALLELAALGTVADLGSLVDENRCIVGQGLRSMRLSASVGLEALIRRAGLGASEISTEEMSFSLIPRLNAAGRIEDPAPSLRLLLTTDRVEADSIADRLEKLNSKRRRLTDRGVAEAENMVARSGQGAGLVVFDPDWHPGILGLIAGRLADSYGRPAVAAGLLNGDVRASARGPEGSMVFDAIRATGLPFLRIGGHPQAAGFSLARRHMDEFTRLFPQMVARVRKGPPQVAQIEYDCELGFREISFETHRFTSSLGPFGRGNPVPMFLSRNVRVERSRAVGRDGSHLQLGLESGGVRMKAIAFRQGSRRDELGDRADLVYSIDVDCWQGERYLQLKVADIRPAS